LSGQDSSSDQPGWWEEGPNLALTGMDRVAGNRSGSEVARQHRNLQADALFADDLCPWQNHAALRTN